MAHTNAKTRKGRILSVRIETRGDESMNSADLGFYSDNPGPADRTVDREADGSKGRGQYRYFVAANSPADTGNPDSVRQDYSRMEALNCGNWGYIGVIAAADITLPGSDIVQKLTSGGLWGIESDSGPAYMAEVENEELAALRGELAAAGFAPRQISLAFKKVKRVQK